MPTASTTRLRARLASQPHEELLDLLVQLASRSAEISRDVDEFLAARNPLPEWAVTRVLLSEDLMPAILAPLDVMHAAAMDVCQTWRMAWRATDGTRRGLRPAAAMPAVTPPLGNHVLDMVALDDERLCISTEWEMRIVNKQMQTRHTIEHGAESLAAGNGRLFTTSASGPECVRSYLLTDYSLAAERVFEEEFVRDLAFAPGGPLFLVTGSENNDDDDDNGRDRIHALDPATLETRFTFGEFDCGALQGIAIVGDELYVGHQPDHSLRVFSFTGEALRDIKGDWRRPAMLRFVNGRLYLFDDRELPRADDSEEVKAAKRPTGRRVFVLTPQGDTLQIYDCTPHLHGTIDVVVSMTVFNKKLIVTSIVAVSMFVLRGF